MTTALVLGVMLAALACPAHMLWRTRRGQQGCCAEMTGVDAELRSLRGRQQALRANVHRIEARAGAGHLRS